MGNTTEETAEATRDCSATPSKRSADYLGSAYEVHARSRLWDEAAVRSKLDTFVRSCPYASRGTGFAASLANSGGRKHPASLPRRTRPVASAEAAGLAVQSPGPLGIPLSGIGITGNDLIITYKPTEGRLT